MPADKPYYHVKRKHMDSYPMITKIQVEEILNKFNPIGDKGPLEIKNLRIYQQAFFHTSWVNTTYGEKESNEKLEFLGDAFIQSAVAHYLYTRKPDANEETLSTLRSKLVNTEALAEFARLYKLNNFLLTGHTVFIPTETMLEDCFEAFVGAMICDFGDEKGYIYAKRFMVATIQHAISDLDALDKKVYNYKDIIQRYYQKHWKTVPQYHQIQEIVAEKNTRFFQVAILMTEEQMRSLGEEIRDVLIDYHVQNNAPELKIPENEFIVGIGEAPKKLAAQQKAAHVAIGMLKIDY